MATKKELVERIQRAAKPFRESGEKVRQVADVLRGPKTMYASLLTPIGFFMLEKPRYRILTDRRLLVLEPPVRGRGAPDLEVAYPRDEVRVLRWEPGSIWNRLELAHPGGRTGFNFARAWRHDAEAFFTALTDR